MGRAYAGILGPLAFATALAQGLAHGSGALATLLTAWLALLAFATFGWLAGRVAEWVVEDSVRTKVAAELAAHERSPAGHHGAQS